jgi:hypothetical protein
LHGTIQKIRPDAEAFPEASYAGTSRCYPWVIGIARGYSVGYRHPWRKGVGGSDGNAGVLPNRLWLFDDL